MRGPLAFVAVSIGGFLVYGLAAGSPFTLVYVPLTVLLAAIVWSIHRRVGFSNRVLWMLSVAAVGNLAGGVLLVGDDILYMTQVAGSVTFDKVEHAFATFAAAWASWEALGAWGSVGSVPGRRFAAVLMANGAGAFVEVAEFAAASMTATNVGDYVNNMSDLVANLIGSLLALALTRRVSRPGVVVS